MLCAFRLVAHAKTPVSNDWLCLFPCGPRPPRVPWASTSVSPLGRCAARGPPSRPLGAFDGAVGGLRLALVLGSSPAPPWGGPKGWFRGNGSAGPLLALDPPRGRRGSLYGGRCSPEIPGNRASGTSRNLGGRLSTSATRPFGCFFPFGLNGDQPGHWPKTKRLEGRGGNRPPFHLDRLSLSRPQLGTRRLGTGHISRDLRIRMTSNPTRIII